MANDAFQISPAIEMPQATAVPAAPGSGNMLLYAKSNSIYAQTPAGVETDLGGSGSGGRTFAYFAS